MNAQQKQDIMTLRKQGLGYKKIAQQLNLNLNSVKSYCRNHQLTAKALLPEVCKHCRSVLNQKEKQKKRVFCSDGCRSSWWNRHRHQVKSTKRVEIICLNCQQSFSAYPHEKRQFCSHECYVTYRFKKEVVS